MLSNKVKKSLEVVATNSIEKNNVSLWERVKEVNKYDSNINVIYKKKEKKNLKKKISKYILIDYEI